MPGDYSRFNDITRKRFTALLMQQGRVQLDSDFNELVDILTTRDRLQALDTFGRAAVPRETSRDAFKLTAAGSDNLVIGAGRMYVDGILVESFGDPATGNPDSYLQQPFYPDPFPLTMGDSQVYLDVWQREVTAIEDPSLLDPALGDIDTATRLQTVWQVRFMPSRNPAEPLTCASPVGVHSAGRLTVTPAPSTKLPDLCEPPDTPGFYDIENRHYRVQIHDVPGGNTARYKWSREGASVVSRVTDIESIPVNQSSVTRLTVDRIGRDAVLRFTPLDWVEIMDDVAALTTMSGPMAQVTDVDEANGTITLDRTIPPLLLENHPRVILWNQRTGVDADGLLWVNPGQTVPLERGLAITFTLDPPDDAFRRGDYWLFPARMADPMAAPLDRARPLPEHHFASLGMISRGAEGVLTVREDCRVLWPDCDCACAACVTPESHNPGGWLTIQQAIEKVKKQGGGTVCVHAGTYLVTQPIVIDGASAITIVGLGDAFLLPVFITLPMFDIRQSKNVTIENLVLSHSGFFDLSGMAMVTIADCDGPVTLTRNLFFSGAEQPPAGVKLSGELSEVYLLRNSFETGIGVDCDSGDLTTVDARFRDNLFKCRTTGIRLAGDQLAADISNNTLVGTIDAGIVVEGTVRSAGAVTICGNGIESHGDGIVAHANDVHITNNSISQGPGDPPVDTGEGSDVADQDFLENAFARRPGQRRRSAIWIRSEAAAPATAITLSVRCHVLANRVVDFRGNGIRLSGSIVSAMIKQNFITRVDGGGISMDEGASAEQLSIENNQIFQNGAGAAESDGCGIRIAHATALDIIANRIGNARDHGIRLGFLANGMIKQNFITSVGCGGIYMDEGGNAEQLSIENNQIAWTGTAANAREGSGIRLWSATTLAILANDISVARNGAGIQLTGIMSAMIKQNVINVALTGGIIMDGEPDRAGARISISNNHILDVGGNSPGSSVAAIRVQNVRDASITDNQISGTHSHEHGSVETITCRAFESAQISGNSISGSVATSRASSDIALTGQRARVTSNVVRREGGTTGSTVNWCVLFVDDIQTLIVGSNDWVVTGGLESPVAFVLRSLHCTFADNVFTTLGNSLPGAILQIHAENSLIVTSNRTHGGTGVALDLSPDHPSVRWTILGNITDGDIHINKHGLPDPWLALNRQVRHANPNDPDVIDDGNVHA